MASLSDIEIKQELRPCYAYGKKALFHLWIKKKDVLINDYVVGLVEYENGVVAEASINNIIFCDNKIKEYYFSNDVSNSKI